MLPEATFTKIDDLYQPTFEHLEARNPRLMILFSGPESSGKSTLARSIEGAFRGLRLENDAVRSIIHQQDPSLNLDQNSKITYSYMDYFREKLLSLTLNGLWIIDSSVDRRYATYAEFAEKHQFPTMLFAIKIAPDLLRQRISHREDPQIKPAAEYFRAMSQRRLEQELFLDNHKPDIMVGADTAPAEIHAAIAKRLHELKIAESRL